MAFDNTKYDIELNDVGYRIQGYQKSEATTFIPRFGSGSQNEYEFDLLRSRTIQDFSGGILQRKWENDQSIFGADGLFPIYGDGVLYQVDPIDRFVGTLGLKAAVVATCTSDTYLFVAVQTYSSPTTHIFKYDASGTRTTITCPAGLQSRRVTSMVIWNNELWVASDGEYNLWWMTQSASSLTQVSASSSLGSPRLLCVFNGQLYGTNAGASDYNVHIWKYTGSKTAISVISAGDTGIRTPDDNASLFEFQGKLYLARRDSLWAYDNIRIAKVDDAMNNISSYNYRFPRVLKGYLYYFMADGLYRFNGSTIEKLYDISEIGFPQDVCVGKNRLWLIYANSEYSGTSRYDKSMGYDNNGTTRIGGRLMAFDGKGLYTYGSNNDLLSTTTQTDFSGQGDFSRVTWFADTIRIFTLHEKVSPGTFYQLETNETNLNKVDPYWSIITSIFDADFSMILKTLENVEIVTDGELDPDCLVNIEYRTYGFEGSGNWETLGSFYPYSSSEVTPAIELGYPIVFQQIQLRFTCSATVGATTAFGIAKIILRYTLSPDLKYQWQFTVNAYGDSATQPLLLKDGTHSTQSVSDLRGNIYAVRSSSYPSVFIDVDQLDLSDTLDDIENPYLNFSLNNASLLKDSGYIKIDDEILYYDFKIENTLYRITRGALGTTIAEHSVGAKVFPAYRVIMRQLANERIEMPDLDPDLQQDVAKPSQITIQIQEV